MTAAEARATMQRAADAAHSISYSGRQSFLAYRNGVTIVAQIDVETRAGQGSQIVVDTSKIITGPPRGTNTTGQELQGPHCVGGGGA